MSERESPIPLSEDENAISFYAGNSSQFDVSNNSAGDLNQLVLEEVSHVPPQKL